jgi:predicted site-specific integrase-resolvase
MTPREAAEQIGCSINQVRVLCRNGTLKHRIIPIPGGYYYEINKASVNHYAGKPQVVGYPRGQKRS